MKSIFKAVVLIIFFFISCNSQKKFVVLIRENDKIIHKSFSDSNRAFIFTQKKIKHFIDKGFISAYYVKKNDSIFIYRNERFFFDTLKIENFPSYSFKPSVANFFRLHKYLKSLTAHYWETGYPFASMQIDTLIFNNNKISVYAIFSPGMYVKFGKIHIRSKIVSEKFIKAYLRIKTDKPFDIQKVQNIDKNINNLDFMRIDKKSRVEFKKNYADLYIYPKKVKANNITGLLGFQNKRGKLQTIGEIKLKLVNIFKLAEVLDFQWNKTDTKSQKLNFNLFYPYIYGSYLGVNFSLQVEKQDSSFVNFSYAPSLQYFFSGMNRISFTYEHCTGIKLAENSQSQNFRQVLYGGGFKIHNRRDFTSKKGYAVELMTMAGYKYYDLKKYSRKKVVFTSEFFIPIYRSFVLRQKFYYAELFGNDIAYNELFAIGGINNLRGFKEREFFLKRYFIVSSEIHYFFNSNSSFFLLYDHGLLSALKQSYYTQTLGLGLRLRSKNNELILILANGKVDNNPFLFSNTKLHIGLRSFF